MSERFEACSTADSGWRPDDPASAPQFRTEGRDLVVELRRWNRGDIGALTPPPDLAEEVGAVLAGRFELHSDGERHELAAGSGILIPPGAPRTWRLLSDSGVLYRVYPK
jgi:mannose-6-phosphate isomerase-like protein (cupin superfamily)